MNGKGLLFWIDCGKKILCLLRQIYPFGEIVGKGEREFEMNVLVYSGPGTSVTSVQHVLQSLKKYVGRFYDIKKIDEVALSNEPWEVGCSLLVIPGGRDVPYLESIKPAAISRIKNWVANDGGKYLGICAGAYFASAKVVFDKGGALEVVGSRPLSFFKGQAVGPLFPGFSYNGHEGACAVKLLPSLRFDSPPFEAYYNGGCHFLDVEATDQIVAKYSNGENAIVFCGVGKGAALLTGAHIEYDSALLDIEKNVPKRLLQELEATEMVKNKFWSDCLRLLELQVEEAATSVSGNMLLSPLLVYSSSDEPSSLSWIGGFKTDEKTFKLVSEGDKLADFDESRPDYLVHVPHGNVFPWMTFNPKAFFNNLKTVAFGHNILYAERIMSTQTVLIKNPGFASQLPSGTVVLAGDQLAGKGRGKNFWLSSTGCLQFTMVIDHESPKTLSIIQYLVATAMAETISRLPGLNLGEIRLKWPNDIYIKRKSDEQMKKAGGILVTSNSIGNAFRLYIGFGINVYDTPWSFCVNDMADGSGPRITKEALLSGFLNSFESLYNTMVTNGRFPADLYYKHWSHQDEIVFLEEEQKQVILKGIDENGYLIAIDLANSDKKHLLQPDGNSFDMMKKLITRKN